MKQKPYTPLFYSGSLSILPQIKNCHYQTAKRKRYILNFGLYLISAFLLSLQLSCGLDGRNKIPEPTYNPHIIHPDQYTRSEGRAMTGDSISRPIRKPARGTQVKAGKEDYIPDKNNYYRLGASRYVPATGKVISMDSVPQSRYDLAKGNVIPFKWPKWQSAKLEYPEVVTIPFSYLGTEQGLNETTAYGLMEDHLGRIWMATAFGVSVWDGTGLANFTAVEGLTGNYVYCLLEDSRQRIWMGTKEDGISVWDGNQFLHYTRTEGLNGNTVRSLLEDEDGKIWIGMEGGGISFYDGKGFTHFTVEQGLVDDRVFSMLKDRSGRIWVGTAQGVSVWDGHSFTNYLGELDGKTVRAILQDRDDRIWLGTNSGVSIWDGTGFTHYGKKEGLLQNDIWCLQLDNAGNVWVGDRQNGVSVWDTLGFAFFTDAEGLRGNSGRSMLKDRNGRIWIGTFGGGVNVFSGSGVIRGLTGNKFLSGNVLSLMQDHSGKFWAGSFQKGISIWDGKGTIRYTQAEGLSSNLVFRILESQSGKIWIGTYTGGVCLWDGPSFVHYTVNEGMSSNIVWSLCEDHLGRLWIGTEGEGGLNMWDGSGFTHFGKAQGLRPFTIYSILEDSTRRIWIATLGGGVYVWDGNKFIRYAKGEGLISDVAFSLLQDRDGRIWIGTDQGISIYDDEGFSHFNLSENAGGNAVTGLIQDTGGDIWAGTFKGLNRLRYQPEQGVMLHKDFLTQDGMVGVQNARMIMDQHNNLWFGTSMGLGNLDLDKQAEDTSHPTVFLQELQTFFDITDWRIILRANKNGERPKGATDGFSPARIHFDSVASFTNLPINPIFPHYFKQLTLSWRGMQPSAPDRLLYSYLLEGKDRSWSPPVEDNKIAYQDLRPGKYTFKVRAVGGNGLWSETAAYSFMIRHPWYWDWYTKIFYLLVAGSIIGVIYRANLHRQLVQAEARRIKELDTFKSQFYTNITHEFRTPLTVILGLAEALQQQVEEGLRSNLALIRRNGRQVLSLVNQMLDLSKIESGTMELSMVQGDVINYMRYLIESFQSLAQSKHIRLHFLTGLDTFQMDFEPDRLQQIVSNLLSNAFKFTPEGRDVYFFANSKGEALEIKVSDTGVGIPTAQLPYIFDRFFQADDSATRQQEGTGIGLALTKELVQLMHGKISVSSQVGRGTEFAVLLPISRVAEKQATILPETDAWQESAFISAPVFAGPVKTQHAPLLLLVEDNHDVIRYLLTCLTTDYRIEIAHNGQQGIEKAIKLVPDLIISDVMMPQKDGFEVCYTLKTDERTSHIPIILLTAKADLESKLAGLQRGADAYLPKPFHKEELLTHIRNLLEVRKKLHAWYLAQAGLRIPISTKVESKPAPAQTLEQAMEHAFIQKIRTLLEADLGRQWLVPELAQSLYVSVSQLHRKLEALTGMHPTEFVRYVRLVHAGRLLRERPEERITAISYEVGFTSPNEFSRRFREVFDVTPGEWRRLESAG